MRSYVPNREIIVLCTRRSTKKFKQLVMNPKVAVLVHDFPHVRFEGGSYVALALYFYISLGC
jgi:uncharacterized pyridoxamine 5'-phosphate oxidase family protein